MRSPEILKQMAGFNKIINGNFDYWQRGNSFTAPVNSDYNVDRFVYVKGGTMVHTASRNTDVPTLSESKSLSAYSLNMACTTADTGGPSGKYCSIVYRVEGSVFKSLLGKTMTLSFWVKTNRPGIYCIAFLNGAVDRSYIAEYTVTATDTWEKITVTIAHDVTGTWNIDNSVGMKMWWSIKDTSYTAVKDTWVDGLAVATTNQTNCCSTTSDYFRMSQVMLHEGKEALDSYVWAGGGIVEELALCQRYYQKSTANYHDMAAGNGTMNVCIPLKVTMRSVPSISGLTGDYTGKSTGIIGKDYFTIGVNEMSAYAGVAGGWTADAELT